MVSHFKAARQKLLQILIRAARQVEHFAAAVALEMVVMVQVCLLVQRFTTRHLHRLDFASFKQCIDRAVNRRLADLCLLFLCQRNQIGDAEWPVRLHDNPMDNGALPRLALSDLHHTVLRQDTETGHKAAIVNSLRSGQRDSGRAGQNWLAVCLFPEALR